MIGKIREEAWAVEDHETVPGMASITAGHGEEDRVVVVGRVHKQTAYYICELQNAKLLCVGFKSQAGLDMARIKQYHQYLRDQLADSAALAQRIRDEQDDIKNATCGDCWYWGKQNTAIETKYDRAACVRYPQVLNPVNDIAALYPLTSRDTDACGEFKRQT